MLQVLLAITLVVLFFIIGFAIYNYEYLNALRKTGVIRASIPIFSGIKDFYTISDEVYNTFDKTNGSYRPINETPSFNQKAGAEYSYNFWLYKDLSEFTNCIKSSTTYADVGFTLQTDNVNTPTVNSLSTNRDGGEQTILFLKGDKEPINYKNICGKTKKDIMIKSPLVKLEQCGKNLTVEFNTISNTDSVSENSPDVCGAENKSWAMSNSHKITLSGFDKPKFDKKWMMITIIIQDTYPSDPYPLRNKIRCRIYVNGLLELDRYVDNKINTTTYSNEDPSILKLNDGHIHIAPRITVTNGGNTYKTYKPNKDKKLMMADLVYYNYALDASDIDTLFASEFTQSMAAPPGGEVLSDIAIYEKAPKPTKKEFIG